MGAAQFGVAVPNFWFALLLDLRVRRLAALVPAGGFPGWGAGVWPALKALILPAVALALPQAAILARVTRSALHRGARRGLYPHRARQGPAATRACCGGMRCATRMIPVLTILGLQFAFLLAGTIIIENVFYLPGLGRLVFQAITQRDLIVVESVVMLLVAAVIVVNLLVDLSYALVDPRLRMPAMSRAALDPSAGPAAALWRKRFANRSFVGRLRHHPADGGDGAALLLLDALRRDASWSSPTACSRLRPRISSAPTISGATCCR